VLLALLPRALFSLASLDGKPKPTTRRRGRKKADYATEQREADIAAAWAVAREGGAYRAEWAREHGMTDAVLAKLLDRVRHRDSRADK